MSGTAAVSNTFQSAVTATGLQLDQNYSTIVAYLNDPTNRNNYAADAGSTNTVVLTFAPPVTGGYTAGLAITFKAAAGNTGGVVVNANGLGNKNLFNAAGIALTGGEITVGQMVSAAYDGTQFQMISPFASTPYSATQGQMETATATGSFVTPNAMKWHPGVAKAGVRFDGSVAGTQTVTTNGFNVSTVIRRGTGTYTINFAAPFSLPPIMTQMCQFSAGGGSFTGVLAELDRAAGSWASSSVTINTSYNNAGAQTAIDPTGVSLIFLGDFP